MNRRSKEKDEGTHKAASVQALALTAYVVAVSQQRNQANSVDHIGAVCGKLSLSRPTLSTLHILWQ